MSIIQPVEGVALATAIDRNTYAGSADVAGILGVEGSFASPFEIACRKKGLTPPVESNEAMELGLYLENYVLRRYEKEQSQKIGRTQVFYRHPDWEFCGATVDGLVFDNGKPVKIVEAKTTADYKWHDLPARYKVQVQWQMGISGIHEADLCVLFLGSYARKVETFSIQFSQEFFDEALDSVIEFWQRYIKGRENPPVDYRDSTTEILKRIQATPGKSINLDDMADDLKRLAEIKAQAKELDNLKTGIENRIRAALDDAEIGLIQGKEACTLKTTAGRKSFDQERFKADQPELFAAYQKIGASYRTLRLKGIKDNGE